MERSGSGNMPRSNSLVMHPHAESGNDRDSPSTMGVTLRSSIDPHVRAEKVKHMSKQHPAILQSQQVNETLVGVQQSLRKMPGIASRESNEIIEQLKGIGVTVSQEWSQLVDALMHMKLDGDETGRSISLLTIEGSVNKARIDDQEVRIQNLLEELEASKADRDELEKQLVEGEDGKREVLAMLQEFERVWGERRAKKKHSDEDSDHSTGSQEMIKRLEETIKCLDEQVNEPRALWDGVVTSTSPHMAFSGTPNEPASSGIHGSRFPSVEMSPQPVHSPMVHINSPADFRLGASQRPATYSSERPQSVGPSAFPTGQGYQGYQYQAAGAPLVRPPSRFGRWNTQGSHATHGKPQTQGPAYQSPTGRWPPPPRQGGYQNHSAKQQRYRGNAPEFTPSATYAPSDSADVWRPSTANTAVPESYGRAPQPQIPARNRKGDNSLRSPTSPTTNDIYSAAMARFTHQGSAIHMNDRCVLAWRGEIESFYDAIRHFVNHNAAKPDGITVAQLRKTPFEKFFPLCYNSLSEQDAETYMEGHLKDPVAKPCLVTRALMDFVINYVWTPTAWQGYDQESTMALAEVKGGLEGSKGQPSYTKQPYLDRLATIIDTIQSQSNVEDFHRDKVGQLINGLISHLQPFFNRFVSPATASQNLTPVAEIAWTLSSKILTSRLTFDFRFPEVGSRFSQQCMVPIWPDLDPMELQAKHWRIALVTTPVITCRNDTGNSISAHSIVHADVYCMQ